MQQSEKTISTQYWMEDKNNPCDQHTWNQFSDDGSVCLELASNLHGTKKMEYNNYYKLV